ncbi:chromatin assembly factor 1 subunit B [Plasmodium inui San Antonio 1]|uniref:Protein HIRA n=1 Tax=Plasmodium inui San Antonio 1 TaxID=1237626 RepID=W7AA42_9APIC|nr:chromatin assembly factor 1 subunit B [Plasmodium inui San Antonio 1]EUD68138.1 chromatin assembly factor 1 subunit B [Plasmodium inui San Antonio 1]
MPHVYLPQILWHSKDNKRSDRIYSVDIQPHPNYYSIKKLNKKYELFKKFIKDKENKCDTHFSVENEVQRGNNSPLSSVHPNGIEKNGEVLIGKDIKCKVSSVHNTVNRHSDENGADDNEKNSIVKKNHCCDTSSGNSSPQEKPTHATLKGEEEHVDSDSQDEEEKKTRKGKKKSIKFNIATCGADEFVHLWRIYIKDDLIVKCLSRFIGHNGEINCVRFNKNGRYLASGGEDKFLYIWEKSKKPRNIPLGYDISFLDYKEWWNIVGSFRCSGVINSITWSNNDTLYIGNEDNNINIIEFVKNSNCKVKVLEGHTGIIQGISLDLNNEFLASLSADQTLKIWKKKNDGKSWKLENSIKNIKADQLEKRSTAYITYDEYEFNEKGADRHEYSATKRDEKKEIHSGSGDLTEEFTNERKGEAGEEQTEKEKVGQKGTLQTQGTRAENEDHEEDDDDADKKKNFARKEEKELGENEPEDEEEEEEEEEEEKKLKRCLFSSEEMLPSFFRRIDFSPNGEFLITPSGIQFEQIEKLHDKNTKPEENVKIINQTKAFSCFYIYHKNLFIRYNIPFFTVFSQTSHFLVAKFNYNTFKLRTHQNILKRCYKHLMISESNDPDGSNSVNKKRKIFDESGFINELKNYEHLMKLNYEKTLLFNDTEVQDDVSEDVSSTISDSDVQYDDEKEDFIDSTGDYSLSNNVDKNEEDQKEKEECGDLAAQAEDSEEETEEDADENEDNEDKDDEEDNEDNEENGENEENDENSETDQNGKNDRNEGGARLDQKQEVADKCCDEKNVLEVCERKEKKEERFIYSLGTFDGSVYFYDSEILDTPISIVKNIHLCPITDISWNNLGNICACSSSDGYVSFYYFDHNELGKVKAYNNYYFEKKCNDLTFDEHYFESTFYDEVDFFNKDQLNDYTSSEDECEESNLSVNKEETKVRRINLIVGNAANFVLEQNTKK